MSIIFASLFENNNATSKVLFFHDTHELNKSENQDILEFTTNTMAESNVQRKSRKYFFKHENNPVKTNLEQIITHIERNEEFSPQSLVSELEQISIRYATIEDEMIEKTRDRINSPTPSNLFFAGTFNQDKHLYTFFIAKIEKNDFFTENEISKVYELKKGLPHKSGHQKLSAKNWKSANIAISVEKNEDNELDTEIEQITLTDSGSTIAKYWSESFLEAKEVSDDEYNTENVYAGIKKIINRINLNDDSAKPDRTHFLNQLNGYMLSNQSFTLEDMKEQVFSNDYQPVSDNIIIQEIIEKVDSLFENRDFARHFTIKKSIIEKKTNKEVKVSDNIKIKISKSIPHLQETIYSDQDERGNYFIKIIVDNPENPAYKEFLFNTQNNEADN